MGVGGVGGWRVHVMVGGDVAGWRVHGVGGGWLVCLRGDGVEVLGWVSFKVVGGILDF